MSSSELYENSEFDLQAKFQSLNKKINTQIPGFAGGASLNMMLVTALTQSIEQRKAAIRSAENDLDEAQRLVGDD